MRAVLCTEYGGPDRLVVDEIDPPALGDGGVRIRVAAVGINFPDLLMTRGEYQFKPAFPFSPGGEVAGEVVEVGAGVDVQMGDRVLALTGWGGLVEEVVAPANRVLKLPAGMDPNTAVAIGVNYATSAYALLNRSQLGAGETLLVHGAAGGVGLAAVEIGRSLGAVVIGTGGSDDKLKVVAEHGADHVINYGNGFKDEVKELTGGRGADVIYDPVGGDVFDESLRCINWGGRLLVIGFASGRIPSAPANLALLKSCSIVGVFYGAWSMREPEAARAQLDQVMGWWTDGTIRPHVSHTFPLERAADAITALANREVIGKAVVSVP